MLLLIFIVQCFLFAANIFVACDRIYNGQNPALSFAIAAFLFPFAIFVAIHTALQARD